MSDGSDEIATTVCDGSDRPLLLPFVQQLEFVFGEGLPWLRHNVNHIIQQNAPFAGNVFAVAVVKDRNKKASL